MDIKNVITELEFTKERSSQEFFDWMFQKNIELSNWSPAHSNETERRKIRYRELGKGLPYKFVHELMPFAYYAKAYYGDNQTAKFLPCCNSEPYDGIINDSDNKIFIEITDSINGRKWSFQKELLIEKGYSPDEHNVHGVLGNKTKQNRSSDDIITSNECIPTLFAIDKLKEKVKNATLDKCHKSMSPKQPYGQNKTILITTFNDTIIHRKEELWNDFIDYKKKEIDHLKHNFKKILLFGWIEKKFID